MADQYPAILLLAPLFAAFAVCLAGSLKREISHPIVIISLLVSTWASIRTLEQVMEVGELVYFLGNWPRPFGIEYRIDSLNALVVLVINIIALITAIYSKPFVEKENPEKVVQFYTLYLLLVTSLIGICLTGDAFNLYVLLEVSSLTSYALIAMGSRRAVLACFNYIIMGTIGASFYLLGVGYLYIKTGSLNMVDIQQILVSENLYESPSVLVAFMMILVGVWIKMAFFPLHGWLPNAYTFAPTTTGCLIAPLMTKVTVYIMIRMMYTVFHGHYTLVHLDWNAIVVFMAIIAIVAGSILALAQIDLRKTLCYLIIAEVGYMVGGAWLANEAGLVGAIYHIISDAFMTSCLFLAAGIIFAKTRQYRIARMSGLFKEMPFTMGAFTLGALSMIGVPPTCGFFSKWYLIRGGIEAGHWGFVIAVLLSSLAIAVIFFRILEVAYFGSLADFREGEHTGTTRVPWASGGTERVTEGSIVALVPLYIAALFVLLIGVFNQTLVFLIGEAVKQFGAVFQ